MKIKEKVVNAMRSFLNIQDPSPTTYVISKSMDEQANTYKNIIWYDGQANELAQFYSQVPEKIDTFWGSIQTAGLEIRKIHTGLPALIVDTLTNITMTDFNDVEFKKEDLTIKETWENIAEENKLDDLLEESTKQSLYKGKGAFKISIDKEISQYPILEYFGKDRVEFIKRRGRIREIIFNTYIVDKRRTYLLKEIYGYGYITYKLYDYDGKIEYDLNACEITKDLVDLEFDKSFMLAVPYKIYDKAIYDKKTDLFDSYDEVYSQWMNALRDGRTTKYIPESLIPKDRNNGELIKPNPFDNKYIKTRGQMTEGQDKIAVETPDIKTENYLSTYITALDASLQGIISPSTLGIDTKKVTDPNATAQREKEKTTLWTRGKIIKAISTSLPSLVKITFYAYQTMYKKPLEEIETTVNFGEYSNPSFEAQVETVGKGKTQGVMSIEASVDELYGASKDEEWKKAEVERLKNEQGIVTDVEIPAVNNVLGGATNENIK